MEILITIAYIIACVLLFALAILIHEFGHFIVALKLGLRVEAFSIGFGTALWKKKINGVEYRISAIPLGGYVSIPDVDPEGTKAIEGVKGERAKDGRVCIPAWKELLVAVAGPAMNIVLAVALAVGLSLVPSARFGELPAKIGSIVEKGPAAEGGMKAGDIVRSVGGRVVETWTDMQTEIQIAGGKSVALPSDGVLFVTAPEPENPLKPRTNADDQIRRMSPPLMELRKEIVALGFNNFSVGGANFNLSADPEFPAASVEKVGQMLRESAEVGVDAIVSIGWPRDKRFSAKYPRIDRDGKVIKGRTEKSAVELDAAHPEAQRTFAAATASFAKKVAGSPDFAGFRPFGEIRLRSTPSFTDYNAAAYRADTGREIPPEARGRAAPKWQNLKDIPANRVVSEHHPVLAFYRWFWQKGDGWNRLDEIAVDAFADATGGRRTFTEYEPCLRIPPLFGIGAPVSHIGNWIYSYDDPVNCDYPIVKSFATARGIPGQQVLTGLQCITHRERIAGANDVPGAPDWTRKYPNCGYPNMPADLLRIGLWTCFARRHEGVSFHSWQCLFDGEKYGVDPNGKGYQFTDPDLVNGLRTFFHEVAEPLGPLFRAVPERPAQVAIVESWASAILSGTAPAFWELAPLDCGIAATAANLMPGCLFEEEIQRDGIADSIEVLLLPMCPVITESTFVKLRAFQRRGGKLVAADDLAPALKADAALPALSTTVRDKAARKEADFRATATALRETVARFCEPAVGSDNPYVHVHARGEKAYDLLFAVNDRRGPGEYVGVYGRVLDKGLPTEGTITLKREAKAVYDLVKHTEVKDFTVAGGRLSIPLRFGGAEGRVFLVCDRALGPLSAAAEGGKVTVTSPDRDVMIPIRVTAEGMKPYAGVVKNGVWTHDFGAVRAVKVTNLADGTDIPFHNGNNR